jgi:hypothetical protein
MYRCEQSGRGWMQLVSVEVPSGASRRQWFPVAMSCTGISSTGLECLDGQRGEPECSMLEPLHIHIIREAPHWIWEVDISSGCAR